MEIILSIIYGIFLIFALLYSGVIVYHVFKYRHLLPPPEARRALTFATVYLIIGGGVLSLSILAGIIYLFLS